MKIVLYWKNGSIYYDIQARVWMHVLFLGVSTPQNQGPFKDKTQALSHATKALNKEGISDYTVIDRT